MLLAGDIGGTKTDLAIFSAESGPRAPLAQAEYRSQDYPGLVEMAAEFLRISKLAVDSACFDVAGPVIAGSAKLTNLPWLLDERGLSRALGLNSVHLLNDLEAVAYAIPVLRPEELISLNAGSPYPGGTIAVIAPGTGLGEAFLTQEDNRYRAHASEGGHADFAPTTQLQIDLLRYLQKRYDHVSYERVCSGIGLPNIYEFLRDSGREVESPTVAAKLTTGPDRTHVIIDAALDTLDPCPLCLASLDVFLSILGAEAGNLALKVLATGGIYLGGGIPTHILSSLQGPGFMEAFVRKGRYAEMLSKVPVRVILAQAALLGAASYGLQLITA